MALFSRRWEATSVSISRMVILFLPWLLAFFPMSLRTYGRKQRHPRNCAEYAPEALPVLTPKTALVSGLRHDVSELLAVGKRGNCLLCCRPSKLRPFGNSRKVRDTFWMVELRNDRREPISTPLPVLRLNTVKQSFSQKWNEKFFELYDGGKLHPVEIIKK